MNSSLLKSFVIGSSYLVVISHWLGLRKMLKNDTAYKGKSEMFKFDIFCKYLILSTVYFGLLNMLITFLRNKYKYNIHNIYLVFSFVSAGIILLHNLRLNVLWEPYSFKSNMDKIIYGIRNFLKHFIVFNFILKGLEIYFASRHFLKEYVLAFIVGSSILAYILWVLSLRKVDIDYYNFDGYLYFILVPVYIGIMNVLSLYFSKKYGISNITRLLVTSLISSLIVINLVYRLKLYNWKDKNKKKRYPLMSFIGHFLTYFIVIYVLENSIKSRR
tara:strand:+ start:863 stop:1681 length:819 start_codon:yes stop_codon:yes gene_type:complete